MLAESRRGSWACCVGVVVVAVLGQQRGRLGLAVGAVVVGVAVLVDRPPSTPSSRTSRLPNASASSSGRSTSAGRPGGQQAPGQQHHDVGPPGLAEVVGGQHDGRAGRRLLADDLQDALLADQVEPGDRLVEQQQVGLGWPGPGRRAPAGAARPTARRTAACAAPPTSSRSAASAIGPAVVGPQPAEQARARRSGPCAARRRRSAASTRAGAAAGRRTRPGCRAPARSCPTSVAPARPAGSAACSCRCRWGRRATSTCPARRAACSGRARRPSRSGRRRRWRRRRRRRRLGIGLGGQERPSVVF